MKAIQMSYQPNVIEFENYERIDEEIIFNDVYNKLIENKDIKIGEKTTGPSEDIYECSLNGSPFQLLYDIDYGTCIKAKETDAINKLMSYING